MRILNKLSPILILITSIYAVEVTTLTSLIYGLDAYGFTEGYQTTSTDLTGGSVSYYYKGYFKGMTLLFIPNSSSLLTLQQQLPLVFTNFLQ